MLSRFFIYILLFCVVQGKSIALSPGVSSEVNFNEEDDESSESNTKLGRFLSKVKPTFYTGVENVIQSYTLQPSSFRILTNSTAIGQFGDDLKASSMAYGVTALAGVKFGYEKFFISPEAFYTFFYLNKGDAILAQAASSLRFNMEYGIRANIGYDISDFMSVFGIVGGSFTNFSFNDGGSGSTSQSQNKLALLYGAGANFQFPKIPNLSLNLKYLRKDINFDYIDGSSNQTNYLLTTDQFITGLTYSF